MVGLSAASGAFLYLDDKPGFSEKFVLVLALKTKCTHWEHAGHCVWEWNKGIEWNQPFSSDSSGGHTLHGLTPKVRNNLGTESANNQPKPCTETQEKAKRINNILNFSQTLDLALMNKVFKWTAQDLSRHAPLSIGRVLGERGTIRER